jgi:hypothetical protein
MVRSMILKKRQTNTCIKQRGIIKKRNRICSKPLHTRWSWCHRPYTNTTYPLSLPAMIWTQWNARYQYCTLKQHTFTITNKTLVYKAFKLSWRELLKWHHCVSSNLQNVSWRRHDLSKRRYLTNDRQDAAFQKIWIFKNTAVRIPNLVGGSRMFSVRYELNH